MNLTQQIEFLKQRVSLCQHFADDRLAQLVQASRVDSFEELRAKLKTKKYEKELRELQARLCQLQLHIDW